VAQKEGVDERTAAWKLADMLRSFKTLSDLEKAIAMANQQLTLLNTANDQQRNAISTLLNLKNAGFTEKDIMELTAVVNTWNKSMESPGLSQGDAHGKKLDTELIDVGH
jgi:alkylhydroperoxidase family enzyme